MAWYDVPLDILDPGGTRHVFETQTADLSSLDDAQKAAAAQQDALAQERAGITPDKSQMGATRVQQQAQLPALQQAAAGAVPSAAQIQGGQAAGAEAARQFAMASAIRGRAGSGAALNQASTGLTANAGQLAEQAANQRAGEQAGARGLLAHTVTGIRGGDLGAYGVDQASRDANLAAMIKEQQLQAQGASDIASANAQAAGLTNQKRASILQGGSSLGMGLLSDKRSKDGVRDKSMADALGKEVHGVTFEYKPGLGDDKTHFGVIAQELAKVIPGVVDRGAPDGLLKVQTGPLTTANTALISELARRIKALEDRR